jgi:hypothetical protein
VRDALGAGGGAEEEPLIRTPDQRLRVFVSSALKELAAERAAARSAITGLQDQVPAVV